MTALRSASWLIPLLLLLMPTALATGTEIGHEIVDQISVASYRNYMLNEVYAHQWNDRRPDGADYIPARDNIVAIMQSFGLEVELHSFEHEGETYYSVVATQPGTESIDEQYLLIANYDAANYGGADYNASGVAALLESARVLSQYDVDITVKYIAFGLTQPWPRTPASEAYVAEHVDDNILGVTEFRMIAYRGYGIDWRGWIFGSVESDPHINALSEAFLTYTSHLDVIAYTTSIPYHFNYSRFEQVGFQACRVYAYSGSGNPCYGEPCDNVDQIGYLDYEYATDFVRGVAGFITDAAGASYPYDCNSDGISDAVQIAADPDLDCNGNHILDVCEDGAELDCNANGAVDFCDISSETSTDNDENGVPDECQPVRYVPGEHATIQDAINAASDGDIIIVADGEYSGSGNRDIVFGGKSLYLRSANGPAACVIDCASGGRAFRFTNWDLQAAAVEGFTIRNADGDQPGAAIDIQSSFPLIRDCVFEDCGSATNTPSGGAIYCYSASPRIIGCTFDVCDAEVGGAIACEGFSSPTIHDCAFTNCGDDSYTFDGGAIYCADSLLNLSDSQFFWCDCYDYGGALACFDQSRVIMEHCHFEDGIAEYGGAIYCDDSTLQADQCTYLHNLAEDGGGAICGDDSADLWIQACEFGENRSFYSGGGAIHVWQGSARYFEVHGCNFFENYSLCEGGAIYNRTEVSSIKRCTFRENYGSYGGAIYTANYNDVTEIEYCVFECNDAFRGGGAMAFKSVEVPIVRNCLLTNNTAEYGGGIAAIDGVPAITNCLIYNNSADYGGGIASTDQSDPQVANTIVWDNSAAIAGDQLALLSTDNPTTMTVSYCAVHGGQANAYVEESSELSWSAGNIDMDPMLAYTGHDYHLVPGSPCIDAGTNEPVGGLPDSDFDGQPRIDGGPGVVDIGLYEFSPNAACIALSESTFEFSAPLGGPNPPGQYLYVRDCGGVTLNWEITADCEWLTPLPAEGASDGESNAIELVVDMLTLPHGDHTCILTIDDPTATNGPRTVEVLIHVYSTLHVPAEYPAIQDAIDNSVHGDTIIVADGVYTGSCNRRIDFGGRRITLRSENGPENCIIDCEQAGRGFLLYSQEGPDSIICGFTITNGKQTCGGGIYCRESSPLITHCIITDCIAGDEPGWGLACGGGVYLNTSGARIINCEISDNIADAHDSLTYGGGIYCRNANEFDRMPVIANCTITGNISSGYGGGISTGGDFQLHNCIVWGNEALHGSQLSCEADAWVTVCYSNIEGGEAAIHFTGDPDFTWGPGNIDANPLFNDPNNGDYHPLPGSPCIDAGANLFVPSDMTDLDSDGDSVEFIPLDLDYEGRFFDDPNTPDTGCGGVPIVDIGAYEFGGSGPQPCLGDFNGNRTIDIIDLATLLGAYARDADGDLDCDGDTDIADLAELLGSYGDSCP